MRAIHYAVGLVLATAALGCAAQNMKPGLWEITNQVQVGGKDMGEAMAQMQKQMASMPPEQRKMMEDMMAKQGVQMGTNANGGLSVKVCMTQDMVERNQISPPGDNCTSSSTPRVGSSMKFSFSCTKPPSSGKGEVTFTSPEAYSMKMTSTSGAAGKEGSVNMQATGRWQGANCGNVKPLQMPKG